MARTAPLLRGGIGAVGGGSGGAHGGGGKRPQLLARYIRQQNVDAAVSLSVARNSSSPIHSGAVVGAGWGAHQRGRAPGEIASRRMPAPCAFRNCNRRLRDTSISKTSIRTPYSPRGDRRLLFIWGRGRGARIRPVARWAKSQAVVSAAPAHLAKRSNKARKTHEQGGAAAASPDVDPDTTSVAFLRWGVGAVRKGRRPPWQPIRSPGIGDITKCRHDRGDADKGRMDSSPSTRGAQGRALSQIKYHTYTQ